MKYILSFFGIVAIFCAVFFCTKKGNEVNDDYLRIHITANSNSDFDKNIKYKVKDAVVDFLIPMLGDVKDKESAEILLKDNLQKIEAVANDALCRFGVKYNAQVTLVEEKIPTRVYDDFSLQSGVYQSLKIDLGQAKGDNWWCVVFPAFCFTETKKSDNIVYISHIWEIIKNVMQKHGG